MSGQVRMVVQSWSEDGRLVRLEERTRLGLTVAVVLALGELPAALFVQRHRRLWSLVTSADVERLEEGERVFATRRALDECVPLCELPLRREALPVGRPAPSLPVAAGPAMMGQLRAQGFFFVTLPPACQRSCAAAYDALEAFCAMPKEYKDSFAGVTEGQLAPRYGYRETSLRKEFFAFRNTAARAVPRELEPWREGFQDIGNLSLALLRELVGEGGAKHFEGDALGPVREEELSHSSFWEGFRYDCAGERLESDADARWRVACAEHCDTGVITIIPAPRGEADGFECFDWAENAWRAVHIAEGDALVFAGELFPFVCGQDVAALSHRVVLPVASKGAARWSLPFELLPVPCPAVAQEVNRLGTGLVSANY